MKKRDSFKSRLFSVELRSGMNWDKEKTTQVIQSTQANDLLVKRMAGPSSAKAGLNVIDRDAINKKIYEISKGSRYFENEKRKEEKLKKKVEDMMEVYKNLNFNEFNIYLPFLNKLEAELENDRDLSQNIIHVDMDAFYAAVEELDNPKLRGVPTAVGGPNMLCTANYEARKYGVRSAMPGFIAKELCPKLNIVPCRFDRYTEISRQVCEIFERYDLNYRAVSLDEAYLNITNYCNENQISAYDAVTKLREEIFEKTKLTASAGIACNSLLAKIASDHRKPNGQFMLESSREEVIKFISSLPIRKVTGIGRVTERVLNSLGIEKCQDIYENRAIVYCLFYEKTFMFLFKASLGIANTNIEILESRKSVGISRTFGELSNLEDLLNKLKELAKSLSEDIEKKKIKGKTVTLTIKSVDFDVRVKSKSFPRYLATCDDLFEAGKKLLIKEHPVSLRLLGLRLSNLISTDENENKNSILKYLKPHKDSKEEIKNNLERQYTDLNEMMLLDDENEDEFTFLTDGEDMLDISNDIDNANEITDNLMPDDFVCPICQNSFNNIFTNLVQINDHIDICLKQPKLKENRASEKKKSKTKENESSRKRKSKTSNSNNSNNSQQAILKYFTKKLK